MMGDLTVAETEAITEKFEDKLQARSGGSAHRPVAVSDDARLRRPVEGHDARTIPMLRSRRACRKRRCGDRRGADARAGEFRRPSHGGPHLPDVRAGRAGAQADRLAVGRVAGVRLAVAGRRAGAAERPGQPPRHLQPAALGGLRRPHRRTAIRRSTTWRPNQAPFQVYDSLLSEAAVLGFEFGYGAGLAAHAGAVGGAVRRFRQRRPGHHRSVHRLQRIEMAARQRPGHAPAARLRGPGTGALQRPARTLSCSCAPRTTSRSATPRRRRSTSTCCGGR